MSLNNDNSTEEFSEMVATDLEVIRKGIQKTLDDRATKTILEMRKLFAAITTGDQSALEEGFLCPSNEHQGRWAERLIAVFSNDFQQQLFGALQKDIPENICEGTSLHSNWQVEMKSYSETMANVMINTMRFSFAKTWPPTPTSLLQLREDLEGSLERGTHELYEVSSNQ